MVKTEGIKGKNSEGQCKCLARQKSKHGVYMCVHGNTFIEIMHRLGLLT